MLLQPTNKKNKHILIIIQFKIYNSIIIINNLIKISLFSIPYITYSIQFRGSLLQLPTKCQRQAIK